MTVLVIGEVLVDRFPDGDRSGGAPFNVACHLKQFGAPVRLITRVGDDEHGRRFHQLLTARGFSAADIQIDTRHATGVVDVTLDDSGGAAFTIREDVAYDHLVLEHLTRDPDWPQVRLIYYGSLIQRGAGGYRQVAALLAQKPAGAVCFCDINLRPPHYCRESVDQCLRFADILKLNEDELETLRRLLDRPAPPEAFGGYLMNHYGISILAVTRGAAGSSIFHSGARIDAPAPPSIAVVDTVGAGDGYSAVLVLGVMRGLPMARTAAVAGEFAAGICRIPGAVPEDPRFYDSWQAGLKDAL